MSCAFDLAHYRELLDAANAGGYRFAFFEGEPREGDVILRHDVDLSLDAALRMAELEAEAGAAATYFLMTRLRLLQPRARRRVSARSPGCASSATASASTPSIRASTSTTASTRLSPGTTPTRSTCASPVEGAINVMEDAVVRPRHVPLRLEPALALAAARTRSSRRRLPRGSSC